MKTDAKREIGVHNRLAHGYLSISDNAIRTTIQDAVPKLLSALQNLLETTEDIA